MTEYYSPQRQAEAEETAYAERLHNRYPTDFTVPTDSAGDHGSVEVNP